MTKILIDRSTMQQALEALINTTAPKNWEVITALRAALAEPQEPDSPERRCGGPGCDGTCCQPVEEPDDGVCDGLRGELCIHQDPSQCKPERDCPAFSAPPQRKPLSGVAIYGLFVRSGLGAYHQKDFVVQTEYDRCIERFARAIERAHGIGGEE